MMQLSSPDNIRTKKSNYTRLGNRLNGVFLSHVMQDGDAVRKLIHDDKWYAKDTLDALYEYYQNHNKEKLIEAIEAIEEECMGVPNISIDNYKGQKTLSDWNLGSDTESKWADLAAYDTKHTLSIYDEMTRPQTQREYENVSVAEILKETIEERAYLVIGKPQTEDENLNLLLSKLYFQRNEKLHQPTYLKALEGMNNNLIEAFTGKREPLDGADYMPAIIMLDELSKGVFDDMDYREQYGFHKSKLSQELLKFSYLTTFRIREFNEKDLDGYLEDVKSSDLWQVAQNKITNKITKNIPSYSTLNWRMLELNMIKPKPREKIYASSYENDLLRANYLNLYIR